MAAGVSGFASGKTGAVHGARDIVHGPRCGRGAVRRSRFVSIAATLLTGALAFTIVNAQTLIVDTKDGRELRVSYVKNTLRKAGVALDSGEVLDFGEVTKISTDRFDAYERAVKLTGRKRARHVTVAFTGKEDVNVLRLRKLEKKRKGAGAARGAGGFMMLLGALSGNRDVYAAGLTTYGVGTIVRDVNTDKMIATQNEAIANLTSRQERPSGHGKKLSLEDEYRRDWGNEVVDGVIALVDGNHERARALASAGETSSDANHRVAAVWLTAIIAADQGDTEAAEKEYERLVILDPELGSVEQGRELMKRLLADLSALRAG